MLGIIVFFIAFAAICAYKLWRWRDNEQQAKRRRARGESYLGGVTLARGRILYQGQAQPLSGVTAVVESVGQLQRRITATRLATIGVFALAMRKKIDDRELYMTIAGPTFEWLVELPPNDGSAARQFASEINNAALRAA